MDFKIVALLPAYNEAESIAATVCALRAQTRVPDEIIVICDNCTDATAEIASDHGATVWTTSGNTHKKAGALNYALERVLPQLEDDDAVLVQDADSFLDPGFVAVAAARLDDGYAAVGGNFHARPGGGICGAFQRNEYARYARDNARKHGRVLCITGVGTLFRVSALRAVAAAIADGRLPDSGGGLVYSYATLTEDNWMTLAALAILATALIASGLVVAGIAAYKVVDPQAPAREQALQQQLITGWQAAPRPTASTPPVVQVRTGQPFALLRIPALGRNWKFAVMEGTSLAQLSTGPGHVTGTQLPGRAGNFAVAAHDITAGNPFLHLKSLTAGDAVYVTTRHATYTYRVTGEKVVRYTQVSVLAPVPGSPGKPATSAHITLITCTPVTLAFTPWRVVVTGVLVSTQPR